MGKSKRPFIDRKKSVKFHLVHRSQHDPLVTDETAPQRVLVESNPKTSDPENRYKEQRKYGIFFDDDYNYLQHLKAPESDIVWESVENPNHSKDKKSTKNQIELPSSVFATEYEEEEGMLLKAAPRPGPRPDWDPDIVAALDDDFDFDNPQNQLDDNFFELAMMNDEEQISLENESTDESDCDSNDPEYSSDNENELDEYEDNLGPLANEETKSRFTEYSISSSVIRRNEQLTLLDDRFEKFFEKYDDNELGGLETDDIEGENKQNARMLKNIYKDYKKSQKNSRVNQKLDKDLIDKCLKYLNFDEEYIEMEVDDGKERKNCESILSTYSNAYNHPKIIQEPKLKNLSKIKIDPKTGMPLDIFNKNSGNKLTTKTLAKFDTENKQSKKDDSQFDCSKSILSAISMLSIRPKNESLEEKRERKHLLKEYRAERRIEKKANAIAFKEEKKRQEKIKINNQMNLQGKRIL